MNVKNIAGWTVFNTVMVLIMCAGQVYSNTQLLRMADAQAATQQELDVVAAQNRAMVREDFKKFAAAQQKKGVEGIDVFKMWAKKMGTSDLTPGSSGK